jgi:transcriptional regulator with XRE-family HTH domain
MTTIGERLRMARESAGLTQLKVADALRINNKMVSLYEHDKSLPPLDNAIELIKLYNVSADYILGFSQTMGTTYGSSVLLDVSEDDLRFLRERAKLNGKSKEMLEDYLLVVKQSEAYSQIYENIQKNSIS